MGTLKNETLMRLNCDFNLNEKDFSKTKTNLIFTSSERAHYFIDPLQKVIMNKNH